MIVPEEARRILRQITQEDIPTWDDIDLRFTRSIPNAQFPCALAPLGVVSVTRRINGALAIGLKTVGMTIGRTIYLAIRPKDLNTAAGLALLAHEKVHADQYSSIPDFQARYTELAERTPANQPWRNPYEEAAYRVEARVYCKLVETGYPRGRWTPLGVSLWGCAA